MLDVGVRRPARLQHRRGDQPERGRLRHRVPAAVPGPDAGADDPRRDVGPDRSDARVPRLQRRSRRTSSRGWVTHHSLQLSFNRRFSNGLSFGFNDTIGLSSRGSTAARLQHNADGTVTYRADQAQADDLLQTPPIRHTMKGNFVWDLPDLKGSGRSAARHGPHRQRLAALRRLDRVDGRHLCRGLQLPERRRQREPDRLSRLRRAHSHHRRPRRAAARAIPTGSSTRRHSRGRSPAASGSNRATAIRRLLRAGARPVDRAQHPAGREPDACNCASTCSTRRTRAGITGRNTTLPLASPSDPVTNVAPVFDPVTGLLNNGVNLTSTGAVSPDRSKPRNAGFGVANAYQAPRSIQIQVSSRSEVIDWRAMRKPLVRRSWPDLSWVDLSARSPWFETRPSPPTMPSRLLHRRRPARVLAAGAAAGVGRLAGAARRRRR